MGYLRHDSPTCEPGSANRSTPVDLDAGRAEEPDALGLRRGLDQMASHRDAGALGRNHGQTLVRDLPVRAVLEVQQSDVHTRTINLDPRYKVKA